MNKEFKDLTVQEVMKLHEENEALKAKLDNMRLLNKTLDGGRQELNEELSQVKEERDGLKDIVKYLNILNLDDERLRESATKYKKDLQNEYSTNIPKASNDKQPTPVEKADNIPHSFASLNDRIERVENTLIKYGYY